MKIKKIKKITVGDTTFSIVWDKESTGGGSFNYGDRVIRIGIKNQEQQRILAILIHELKEIIQVEQRTRLDRFDVDGEYIFVYNHAQHTDLCSRLAGLLNNFIA